MYTTTSPETRQLAKETYVYGYPLVLTEMTRRMMTHVAAPDPTTQKAPLGQFVHQEVLPTARFRHASFPNVDTLSSLAWLDLSAGPMVLHVPNTHGRYYVMPILDAWTDVVTVLGKRTTGTHVADFALVRFGWADPLPAALKIIAAPTNLVRVVGSTRVSGPTDLPTVNAIQQGYHLKPLSSWGRIYTPPRVPVDPTVDVLVPPVDQVARMDAATYFRTLATAMQANPPHATDEAMLPILASVGIVQGHRFDFASLSSMTQQALQDAIPLAHEQIQSEIGNLGDEVNGWVCRLGLERNTTDYMRRAASAWSRLGYHLSADALCSYTEKDRAGEPLNGAHPYVLHFAPHRTPPVNGFWSLTMYGSDRFLVKNPIDRYAISNRDALQFNVDGSLDICIQHAPPGPEKLANWLPAPFGDFSLILRMYWPKPDAINRAWLPPAIQRVHEVPPIPDPSTCRPSAIG